MASVGDQNLTDALQEVVEDFDCVGGTIHRIDDGVLDLVAHVGIPEEVLERTERIPIGKGMGGLAAEREEPVQICNLQTDDSGRAKDGAKATGMEGTIAVPMFDEEGSLEGVLGVGKRAEYEFSESEEAELLDIGRKMAERW